MSQTTILVGMTLLLAILAWAPWLSEGSARAAAESSFEQSWLGVADGCGLSCIDCGALEAQRVAFGFAVTLEYACGMLPADLPEFHQRVTGFVLFAGNVYGLPAP